MDTSVNRIVVPDDEKAIDEVALIRADGAS